MGKFPQDHSFLHTRLSHIRQTSQGHDQQIDPKVYKKVSQYPA